LIQSRQMPLHLQVRHQLKILTSLDLLIDKLL
jgi:hypothetical protein